MIESLLSLASFFSFMNQVLPLFSDGIFGTNIAFSCFFLLISYLLTLPVTTHLARFPMFFMVVVEFVISNYILHCKYVHVIRVLCTIFSMILLVDTHIKFMEAIQHQNRRLVAVRRYFDNQIMGNPLLN